MHQIMRKKIMRFAIASMVKHCFGIVVTQYSTSNCNVDELMVLTKGSTNIVIIWLPALSDAEED